MPATWQPRPKAESWHFVKENLLKALQIIRTVGFLQKLSTIDDATKYRGVLVSRYFLRRYIIFGHFLIPCIRRNCFLISLWVKYGHFSLNCDLWHWPINLTEYSRGEPPCQMSKSKRYFVGNLLSQGTHAHGRATALPGPQSGRISGCVCSVHGSLADWMELSSAAGTL